MQIKDETNTRDNTSKSDRFFSKLAKKSKESHRARLAFFGGLTATFFSLFVAFLSIYISTSGGRTMTTVALVGMIVFLVLAGVFLWLTVNFYSWSKNNPPPDIQKAILEKLTSMDEKLDKLDKLDSMDAKLDSMNAKLEEVLKNGKFRG